MTNDTRDDVHMVDVCVPGWLHAEIAIAALEFDEGLQVQRILAAIEQSAAANSAIVRL